MTTLKLTRLNEPNIEKLYEMKSALRNMDKDGSFKLFSTYRIPSDARVDFCHEPTYICSSILMKAYLTGDSKLKEKIETPLIHGLERCCCRNLTGHGYDSLQGQIEALNIFMKGGLREFIDLHPDLNSKFTEMILNIMVEFDAREEQEAFKGTWGEDYKENILKINEYFSTRKVFVYGTLMTGESNHHFLENSTCLGKAAIEGYDMYNVGGFYPAIIPGNSRIIGELYEVHENDMASIDMLEGEGSLYIRKCEITTGNELAYIYEYAQDTEGLDKIDSWKEYIWYVSYGSNMLEKRFLCYIEGGCFEGSASYRYPCEDPTRPLEKRAIDIPYDMYFGNYSGSWEGCGVSFLDTTKDGHALGVAYLITREQFEHVAAEENGGRSPGYGNWYEDIISLGEMDGFEMLTISNNELRPYNEPCEEYLNTLKRGIRENWSEMSEEDIENYLDSCIREF